jgi:hypothetical protein
LQQDHDLLQVDIEEFGQEYDTLQKELDLLGQEYDELQAVIDNMAHELDLNDCCTAGNHEMVLEKFAARERISLQVIEIRPKTKLLVVASERGQTGDLELLSLKIADPNDVALDTNLNAGPFNDTLSSALAKAGFRQGDDQCRHATPRARPVDQHHSAGHHLGGE